MSKRWIKAGAADQTIDIFALNSSSTTGAGLTGLVHNTSGLTCYYRKGATGTATALTLATQTVGGAHSDGGFVEIDATNMPGVYRLDLSDAVVNTAGMVTVYMRGATNLAPVVLEIECVSVDVYDAVRMGLTALPNVTSGSAGAIITSGTGTAQLSVSSGLVTLAGVTHTGAVIPTVTTTTTATNLTNERGKYAEGAVWIGPAANTNTVSYTDGITTNPVSTVAAAKTIADALGLRRFHITRTGTVQIGAAVAGYDFYGANWTLTTTGGSQDVGTSHFVDANVTAGTFASTTGTISWEYCEFADGVTVGVSNMVGCRFQGGLTLSTAGNYDFVDCTSVVAGTSAPTFTVPSGTVNVSFRRWSGGITISGITSGTTVSIDVVSGGTVTLNGADGNVQVRGMVSGITDNRTGSPTLGQNAAINITKINTECDTALTDYGALKPTVAGRTLDVSAGGEAGVDWANVGSPTTSLNLSGTTISTSQAIASVSGAVGSVTGAVGSVTGNVGGNVTGSVGSIATGGIAAASFAANSITAAALAADAVTEIQTGLSTLDAAGIRTAVGLASANLDTQLSTIDTVVDSILDDTGTSGVVIATATQAAITDKILGRNVAGGSDGGRTVSEALYAIRNRVDFPATTGGTMTVYATDDTTPSWTATVTLASRDPATSINPA